MSRKPSTSSSDTLGSKESSTGGGEQLVLEVEDNQYDHHLFEELDIFLQFKDQSLHQEFLYYCHQLQRQSNVFLIFITLFFAIFMLTGSISTLKMDLEHSALPHFYPRLTTAIIAIISSLTAIIIGIQVYCWKRSEDKNRNSKYWRQVKISPKAASNGASNGGSSAASSGSGSGSATATAANGNADQEAPQSLSSRESSEQSVNEEWMHYCSVPLPVAYSFSSLASSTGSTWFSCWKQLHTKLQDIHIQQWFMIYFAIQLQICFTCVFIRRVYNLNCFPHVYTTMEVVGGSVCYSDNLKTNIIASNSVYILLIPVLFMLGLPEVPIKVIWYLHGFSIAIFTIVIATLNAFSTIPVAMVWISTSCILLREFQFRNLLIFRTNRKLRKAIKANHKIQSESHAMEMRHLISNMAHDLKTPLSSFITGIEYIQLTVDNFRTSLPTDNKSTDGVMDFVSNVNLCLNNIRNTNAFMLMTINRCIDYSKASKGMQLIPRYESLNLLEAIQLPISCMINMQNRIQVHLQPFPTEICSHILTDKQWLQENMLCLLSNAVKYSSIGEVIVCVSMVRASSSSTTTPSEDIAPPPPSACMQANDHEGKESIHHEHTFNMYKSNLPSTTTRVAKGKNAEESGWYLRIEVEDAGIGMSEQDMQLLFHPIKQTQRFAGGTGLGLYSLAKRVEALHGEYGVKKRSDNSHGLLFWFTIPYRPDPTYLEVKKGASSQGGAVCVKLADPRLNPIRYPVDQCPSSMSVKAVANVKAPLQSLTILLVDDSHSILKMTSMMLTKLGHHVITAENGLVALQKITSYLEDSTAPKIDLILMDLQMPVMDGLEATKRIRQAEVNLPSSSTASLIIGVSANSDHETTKASYEAGVDAFLSKPFNIASFQEIYQKVLFARLALADNITSSGSNQLES